MENAEWKTASEEFYFPHAVRDANSYSDDSLPPAGAAPPPSLHPHPTPALDTSSWPQLVCPPSLYPSAAEARLPLTAWNGQTACLEETTTQGPLFEGANDHEFNPFLPDLSWYQDTYRRQQSAHASMGPVLPPTSQPYEQYGPDFSAQPQSAPAFLTPSLPSFMTPTDLPTGGQNVATPHLTFATTNWSDEPQAQAYQFAAQPRFAYESTTDPSSDPSTSLEFASGSSVEVTSRSVSPSVDGQLGAVLDSSKQDPTSESATPRRESSPAPPSATASLLELGFTENGKCKVPGCTKVVKKERNAGERDKHLFSHLPNSFFCLLCEHPSTRADSSKVHLLGHHVPQALERVITEEHLRARLVASMEVETAGVTNQGKPIEANYALIDAILRQGAKNTRCSREELEKIVSHWKKNETTTRTNGSAEDLELKKSSKGRMVGGLEARMRAYGLLEIRRPRWWPYSLFSLDRNRDSEGVVEVTGRTQAEGDQGLTNEEALDRHLREATANRRQPTKKKRGAKDEERPQKRQRRDSDASH